MQFMNSIKGSIREQTAHEILPSPGSPKFKEFKTPYTTEKQNLGNQLVDSDDRVFPQSEERHQESPQFTFDFDQINIHQQSSSNKPSQSRIEAIKQ